MLPTTSDYGTYHVSIVASYYFDYIYEDSFEFILYIEDPYCWNHHPYKMFTLADQTHNTNSPTPTVIDIVPIDFCYLDVTFSFATLPYFITYDSTLL